MTTFLDTIPPRPPMGDRMTTERTSIDPSAIREGDVIRKEFSRPDSFRRAIEYVASSDCHGLGGVGQHYLLERPTPPVVLPTEPTLGWLTFFGDTALSVFVKTDDGLVASRVVFDNRSEGPGAAETFVTKVSNVTGFVPATAVPTSALTDLRHEAQHTNDPKTGMRLRDFLESIDNPNGAS